jgi:MFS family permease
VLVLILVPIQILLHSQKKQRKIGISTINKAFQFRKRQRIALSAFFFLSGFCFSSWASRIPTIKANLDINEAELGTLLLVMPLSQFAGLPLSGWLVSKFDSRGPLAVAFLVHLVLLVMIAHAKSIFIMAAVLFAFAFFSRIFNIAMNTQSVVLSKAYSKPINGSFHALWSLGGIAGAIITTIMIALKINMSQQFMVVALLSATLTTLIYKSLISNDRSHARNKILLGKPDLQILLLGAIIILAAICEGGMFDWSSVYFREVIGVEIFTTGYLTFMICMALSRFLTDRVIARAGMKKTYQLSVFLMTSGMLLALVFPHFWAAMIGFSLFGFGTAAIFPMTFLLAGSSEKYAPGMAISLIATYALLGILIGPAAIGYLAYLFGLRIAFLFIAACAVGILPLTFYYFTKFRSLN